MIRVVGVTAQDGESDNDPAGREERAWVSLRCMDDIQLAALGTLLNVGLRGERQSILAESTSTKGRRKVVLWAF